MQLQFFRQHFYNATLVVQGMRQQNTISCAKQESQPNKSQMKLIHFQEILSSTIDGQPVTKTRLNNNKVKKQKKKKEGKTAVFLRKNPIRFPY